MSAMALAARPKLPRVETRNPVRNGPSEARTLPALKQKPAPVARSRVGYSSGTYRGNPLKIPLLKNPKRGRRHSTWL